MTKKEKPALFGLEHSNRDFSNPESWGKNQFNSSFPAALACYMGSKGVHPVYITLNEKMKAVHSAIKVADFLGMEPLSPHLFFSFETSHNPFMTKVIGSLPRTDLVTVDTSKDKYVSLRPIEIKLTALPDHVTCELPEEQYGCEIVTRPDTIVYLAFSIAEAYEKDRGKLKNCFEPIFKRKINWSSTVDVAPLLSELIEKLDLVLANACDRQTPMVLQPVWKTLGKSAKLNDNCLDIFVWSSHAYTRLFVDPSRGSDGKYITRHMRSVIWLTKLLYDFGCHGKVNHELIIDSMTYDTKNDKAFAVSGSVTHPYMKGPVLTKPRIKKEEIKNIILGGGEKLLSPERRFDAIILNTPGLF